MNKEAVFAVTVVRGNDVVINGFDDKRFHFAIDPNDPKLVAKLVKKAYRLAGRRISTYNDHLIVTRKMEYGHPTGWAFIHDKAAKYGF